MQRTMSWLSVLSLCLIALMSAPSGRAAADVGEPCDASESGVLETSDLPEGSDVVECDAVGRLLDLGDATLLVPAPNGGVWMDALLVDRTERHAQIYADGGGDLSYASDSLDGPQRARPSRRPSPAQTRTRTSSTPRTAS